MIEFCSADHLEMLLPGICSRMKYYGYQFSLLGKGRRNSLLRGRTIWSPLMHCACVEVAHFCHSPKLGKSIQQATWSFSVFQSSLSASYPPWRPALDRFLTTSLSSSMPFKVWTSSSRFSLKRRILRTDRGTVEQLFGCCLFFVLFCFCFFFLFFFFF